MGHVSPPLSILVLGNPETRLGSFIERNLRAAKIVGYFADSSDRLASLSSEVGTSHMILIDPDCGMMLLFGFAETRVLLCGGEAKPGRLLGRA
jgi:hypothetical protein